MNLFGNRFPDKLTLATLLSLTYFGMLIGAVIRVNVLRMPVGLSFGRNVGVSTSPDNYSICIWRLIPGRAVATSEWHSIGFRYFAWPTTVGACHQLVIPYWCL